MSFKVIAFSVLFALAIAMSAGEQIVGGAKEIDPERIPEITDLLKNNLHKLEGETLKKLVEVKKITEQVVSGMLYTITGVFEDKDNAQFTCEITIWERSWLDEPDKMTFQLLSKTALLSANSPNSGSETHKNYFLLFSAFVMFKLLL